MTAQERDLAQLVGHPPPARPVPPPAPRTRARVNSPAAPRRGHARAGAGWAPVEPPLVVYQASTHEIGGLFPLLAAHGVPAVGARIG